MTLKRKLPPGNVRRTISLGNNFRGVTTNKRGHLVQFESEQERKLVLLLERDSTVTNFISQPEVINFRNANGRQQRYTPDFKVWRTDGKIELHEVTIESRREEREYRQNREAAAQAVCQQRGWCYVVHTDQTLPSGYEYANLDFLSPFRAKIYSNAEITTWWLGQLVNLEQRHPRIILNQTGFAPSSLSGKEMYAGSSLNSLYHLIWHSIIQINWHQPFIWRGDFHPTACIWLTKKHSTNLASNLAGKEVKEVQS